MTVNDVLRQKGRKSSLNDLIKLTVECKQFVRPKVYEKLFRLLQSVLKKKCSFTMPRRVVLRTPTLCPSTERTSRQTVKAHFSSAPMPAYLQDLCKSVKMGCPTVRGCIVRYPNVTPPYYGALFVGDGVSLPTPPQFGCDECILTRVTSYQNRKGGKSWAKQLGSSWYLTPLLWDTPFQ